MPPVVTVTGCVADGPLPEATVNGRVVGLKVSVGQPEHTATTSPLVTPRVVESPSKVWPAPGVYVPWLFELMMFACGKASGIGAGMVPPGNAPVVTNCVFPALKVQLLDNESVLALTETVAAAVQLKLNVPAESVRSEEHTSE